VLSLAPRDRPKVCFVPTASGDAESYIDRFYASFNELPCTPSHLSLFKLPSADLRSFVREQDVIYVGGGNTRSMLALWREWQLDRIFREAWEEGMVLAGISAGSICWFEQGTTDSIPGDLTVLRCLGFLDGSNCPHYDGEPARRPSYRRMVAEGTIGAGYATDDGVALHYVGTELRQIVSSRPHAMAYRLERVNGTAEETPLAPTFLG
jgi:peptidase E